MVKALLGLAALFFVGGIIATITTHIRLTTGEPTHTTDSAQQSIGASGAGTPDLGHQIGQFVTALVAIFRAVHRLVAAVLAALGGLPAAFEPMAGALEMALALLFVMGLLYMRRENRWWW